MNLTPPEAGNLLEVPVSGLRPGMYVAALDRPWLETPFAVQGFFVKDRTDVDFVAEHCAHVYVDPRRRTSARDQERPLRRRRTYRDTSSLKSELKTAKVDLTSASESMARVFAQLRTGGHLDIQIVRSAISPLIESVLRNSEAIGALIRMKKQGEYLYNHSLAVSVWAAILGRHLGLERKRLEELALGAALLDVGMASIDEALAKSGDALDEQGRAEVVKHVPLGVDLLKMSKGLSSETLEMIATHHERHNGSGYPNGLVGSEIPMFGRIAGLVDSYDAMITPRPYAVCRSSFEAMQELSDSKDELFQGALVEQFVQAVGLFPTGSVVQLNTGEIGVIVQQNEVRRLRPKLVMVLTADGKRHKTLTILDLAKYGSGGRERSDLWITRELEPGSHGIHPDEFFL